MSPQQTAGDAGADQEDSSSVGGYTSRRRRAKGPSDTGGEDPGQGIANAVAKDVDDDVQQTLDDIVAEVEAGDFVVDDEEDGEGEVDSDDASQSDADGTPAAAAGGAVAPEGAASEVGELSGGEDIDGEGDVNVDVEIVDDPTQLQPAHNMVQIELADGEVVNGRVVKIKDDSIEVWHKFDLFFDEFDNGHNFREIDMELLEDEDTTIRSFDTANLTDIPGVKPFTPASGGYNDIPDGVTDTLELAEYIRDGQQWWQASGINSQVADMPIDANRAKELREKQAELMSRLRDDEMKREYAKRTIIGDDRPHPSNAMFYTPNGRPMNMMMARTEENLGDTEHEFGHGIAQMRGHVSGSTSILRRRGSYWESSVDPLNDDEFKEYLHTSEGTRSGEEDGNPHADTATGWDDWSGDAKGRILNSSEFESVGGSLDTEVETGDVLRFDDEPFDMYTGREWEVVEATDSDSDILTLRSSEGATTTVAAEALRRGHEPVEGVARGYSDIDGKADSGGYPETKFTSREADTPTVDELRGEYSAETWEAKVDNFASQANRAYYEMWLRNATRGQEIGIRDGYSSKQSHEVMAQMSEVFQTKKETVAEEATKVAQYYPEVTAAYLELSEPSPTVKEKLSKVDGVTVDQS